MTGGRDTEEARARLGELPLLMPQGMPAPLPLRCEKEDREVGRGQVEPHPKRDQYPGSAVVREGGQGKRVSDAGRSLASDTPDATFQPPALIYRAAMKGLGQVPWYSKGN